MNYLNIKNFNGVISRNQVPQIMEYGLYVVNLDDDTGPGTHWVVICVNHDIVFYFDSFGMKPPAEVIKLSNNSYIANTSQYQHMDSVLCGYFCIFFAHRYSQIKEENNRKKYIQILKPLKKNNTTYNENLIKHYFI